MSDFFGGSEMRYGLYPDDLAMLRGGLHGVPFIGDRDAILGESAGRDQEQRKSLHVRSIAHSTAQVRNLWR